MLEQNKCDIRDQHGLEHISHRLIVRIDDFSIFTPRTMHPNAHASSANAVWFSKSEHCTKSLKNSKNNIGAIMEPCGTPLFEFNNVDWQLLVQVNCFLSVR